MEGLFLLLLLAAPLVMLLAATKLRKARERSLDERGVARPVSSTSKPWDKGMRNAMLLGLSGLLCVIAGLYAYSVAAGTRSAPLFALPVVGGVVLLARAYRLWMRAVDQVPDDAPRA
ncbi:MAG TPA: hypothetical protein VMV18_04315 [bacterium]|nr:hypothetical protein [bacterium]